VPSGEVGELVCVGNPVLTFKPAQVPEVSAVE
jgi:hypothetical protein